MRGREKSASFSATSREAWASSHASKTNAPEVGKYKPKFSQIEPKELATVIRAPQKNVGADRILQRELQHTFMCNHAIKVLCDKNARTTQKARASDANQKESIDEGQDDNKSHKNEPLSLNIENATGEVSEINEGV